MRIKFFVFLILFKISLINAVEECGKVQMDINNVSSIGGNYSEPGQWPWLAAIYRGGKYQCGASIISKRHLLGAAHCVHLKGNNHPYPVQDFHALLGAYDLNKNEENSVKVYFSNISIHPDWDPDINNLRYDADIAVFTMASEVEFTTLIQPICLPKPHAKIFDVDGTVVGYGLSETSSPHENRPKHVQIKSVEYEDCVFTDTNLGRYGSKRMFCAGERGKNPCRGDSGSPFMVREDDHWLIIGIVSTAVRINCHENDFVLFTRVPKFLGWIKEEMTKRGNFLSVEFSCEFDPFWKSSTTCYTKSLETPEPNFKVTSISLNEALNFNKIEKIWIERAEVHHLPDLSLASEKFLNLRKLSIWSSGLKELDRSKLALLPQLTDLDVSENHIQELSEDIFDVLKDLKILNFELNQVEILHQKLLWKLPKLKEFRASGNQIEAIPARFFELNKNLEEIWLNDNKISRIEIDLKELTRLKIFKLAGNECIDRNFNIGGGRKALRNENQFQEIINENCR